MAQPNVYFSPSNGPKDHLIELIESTQNSIHAAVYMLTDLEIAQALAKAFQRGVEVTIIIDPISATAYGKAEYLFQQKVPVYVFNPKKPKTRFTWQPIMHHKFAIFDMTTVWTGSYNWTQAANNKNFENAISTYDPQLAALYEAQFTLMLRDNVSPYVPVTKSPTIVNSLRSALVEALEQPYNDSELYERLLIMIEVQF